LFVKPHRQIFDISIASDERDYDEEVIFSNQLIGVNDGNKLPIHFDLNNSGTLSSVGLLNLNVQVVSLIGIDTQQEFSALIDRIVIA
jgi:hypothetical protein